MRKHGKSPESTQKLRNFNALKSKTASYPQATKSVIVGNPFASVSGDDAMDNARSKRIGRTTGKSTDRFIRHEHLRQAQTPVAKQEISVAAKPVERIFWDSELPGFGVRAYPLIKDDRVVWDQTLPGFGLRFHASGRRTWIVFTRIRGVVSKIHLGNAAVVTEAEARNKAQLLILEAKVRRDPLARRKQARATPQFHEFCATYWRRCAVRTVRSCGSVAS